MTIRPTRLRPGSTLGVFSPSEPLTAERQQRMRPSIALLERNFAVQFSRHALAETYYTAGSVTERLSDIDELLEDDGVDCLLASWGGKNANQLVRCLPYAELARRRKPIVGFSDVCVILNAITAETGLITFCGPNIAGKMAESEHWGLDLLQGAELLPLDARPALSFRRSDPGRHRARSTEATSRRLSLGWPARRRWRAWMT